MHKKNLTALYLFIKVIQSIIKAFFEDALEKYKKALEIEKDSNSIWNIHNRLCATYVRLKDLQNALIEADHMISTKPSIPKGYIRKGGVLFSQNKIEDALKEYNFALSLIDRKNSSQKRKLAENDSEEKELPNSEKSSPEEILERGKMRWKLMMYIAEAQKKN